MDSSLPNFKSINATKFKAGSRGRGGRGRGRGAKSADHGSSKRAAVVVDHKAGAQSVPSEDINDDEYDETSYVMTGEEILVKERIAIDLPTYRNEAHGDLMIKTYLTQNQCEFLVNQLKTLMMNDRLGLEHSDCYDEEGEDSDFPTDGENTTECSDDDGSDTGVDIALVSPPPGSSVVLEDTKGRATSGAFVDGVLEHSVAIKTKIHLAPVPQNPPSAAVALPSSLPLSVVTASTKSVCDDDLDDLLSLGTVSTTAKPLPTSTVFVAGISTKSGGPAPVVPPSSSGDAELDALLDL